jgi:hypothetical protein
MSLIGSIALAAAVLTADAAMIGRVVPLFVDNHHWLPRARRSATIRSVTLGNERKR